jgi:hypothetical protein
LKIESSVARGDTRRSVGRGVPLVATDATAAGAGALAAGRRATAKKRSVALAR